MAERGIVVYHQPELFKNTNKDARIITSPMGNTGIFLNLYDGENPAYERFLLWHEIGHIETDGLSIKGRFFSASERSKAEEISANIFAFVALVQQQRIIPDNWYELSKKIGMPYLVLSELMMVMQKDHDFIQYLNKQN